MVTGAKVMQCMRSLFSTERIALCIVALLVVGQASYSTADAGPVSKKRAKESGDTFGRPLSAAELRQLYNGRTWLWENGGGYMDPSGRFGAVIDSWNGRMSMADGEWTTNDRGRLCFKGSWRSQTGKTHSESCFTHYAWGDVIYQRKEPNGSWYIFKNSPAAESDEFNMIVQGNRIAVPISSKRPAQASDRRKRK